MPSLLRKGKLHLTVCRVCGLGCLDPMPDPARLAEIYGPDYFAAWSAEGDAEPTRQMKKATFSRLLADSLPWMEPGTRVLDVGCATGFFLEVAAARGFEPFGLDISPYAIDACTKRFGADHLFCGQLGDATFAANPDGTFGAIFMSDSIEHVVSPRDLLTAAAQRLAPQGVLVITTPNLAHLSRRLMGSHWPHINDEHLWYFSPSNLARLLSETGLLVVSTGANKKALSIAYVDGQLQRYPMSVLTPTFRALSHLLPDPLIQVIFRIPTGDMTLIAVQRSSHG